MRDTDLDGTAVRPLERGDLPGVRRLFERFARTGGSCPPPPVEEHFARTLLDHPWADPELPSLVYDGGDGEILGLLGSYARRMVCDGRALRVRVPGGFVVDGAVRGRGIGSRLLDALFTGPQDLTLADGANDALRVLWTAAGGHPVVHASIGWRRVLHPGRAAAMSDWSARRPAPVRLSVAALARPADAVLDALPPIRGRIRPARSGTTAELLTPETLTTLVAERGRRLRPDYDPDYLDWLFTELDPGGLVRHLVRGADGEPLGWYLYAPGARAQVLQVGSCGPDRPGAVLDHLFADADARGAAVLEGRLEPDLADALRTRRVSLFPTTWTLVHTDDVRTSALLCSPDGMCTRLDGEWWVGFLLWRAGRSTNAVP